MNSQMMSWIRSYKRQCASGEMFENEQIVGGTMPLLGKI